MDERGNKCWYGVDTVSMVQLMPQDTMKAPSWAGFLVGAYAPIPMPPDNKVSLPAYGLRKDTLLPSEHLNSPLRTYLVQYVVTGCLGTCYQCPSLGK